MGGVGYIDQLNNRTKVIVAIRVPVCALRFVATTINNSITNTIMKTTLLIVLAATALLANIHAAAPTPATETKEQRAARMEWWREARFGMFIHWGVYAVPAGEWDGKTNYGEWFLEETKMPVSQYEKFAAQFNPVKFDAKAWVGIAKAAGMKYIVITSKHHDGFCLWPTAQTDWSIRRTPFQRDPLAELAAECRKAGIRFCIYHSIMDWHHPDWGMRRAWNDVAVGTPDMNRFTAYLKSELKELVTNYHPGVLWFDGEWENPWTHERGEDLYAYLRGLDPKLIINNRVGKGRKGMSGMDKEGQGVGDFGTPEQEVPPSGFGPSVDWETCMTLNNHWGYNKSDNHWKSTATLIQHLAAIAGKGGNYLLNVGPTAAGEIPQPSIARLAEMGRWMKQNGESIYGTTGGPWNATSAIVSTRKAKTIYVHILKWPDGAVKLPNIPAKIVSAKLLNSGKAKLRQTEAGIEISVAPENRDAADTVIALKLDCDASKIPALDIAPD